MRQGSKNQNFFSFEFLNQNKTLFKHLKILFEFKQNMLFETFFLTLSKKLFLHGIP